MFIKPPAPCLLNIHCLRHHSTQYPIHFDCFGLRTALVPPPPAPPARSAPPLPPRPRDGCPPRFAHNDRAVLIAS